MPSPTLPRAISLPCEVRLCLGSSLDLGHTRCCQQQHDDHHGQSAHIVSYGVLSLLTIPLSTRNTESMLNPVGIGRKA